MTIEWEEGCNVYDDGLTGKQWQELFGKAMVKTSLAFKLRKRMASLGATKQKKRLNTIADSLK